MVRPIPDNSQTEPFDIVDRAPFNLAQFIHPDRFSAFMDASNQNVGIAENLYIWNIQVSAAFWGGFHILEITLRNVIHEKFREHANVEEWWDTDLPIHDGDRGSVQEAVAKVNEDKKSPTPGHVIAELNLGFWVGLFANNYHSALWKGRLEYVFPNFSGQRKELHSDLERLRKLRNRIAHHEPICFINGFPTKDTTFARQHYTLILQLFQWMSINESALLYGIDHINSVCNQIDNL